MAVLCYWGGKKGKVWSRSSRLNDWRGLLLCALVWCFFSSCLSGLVHASNDIFNFDDNCTKTSNFTLSATESRKIFPSSFHNDANRTSLVYDVKACGDAYVILYALNVTLEPRASVFQVVLGKGAPEAEESAIMNCTSPCTNAKSVQSNPLNCSESKRFGVRWEKGDLEVFVWRQDKTWDPFLNFSSTSLGQLHGVYVAYKLDHAGPPLSATSLWTIQTPCEESEGVSTTDNLCQEDAVESSGGQLAGAVIGSLLAGVLIGVLAVVFGPRLVACIRQWTPEALPWKRQKADDAQTADELAELQPQDSSTPTSPSSSPTTKSPDPAHTPTSSSPDTTTKVDLALPGDQHPPATSTPTARKASSSNTYTPYHQMGGGAQPPKKQDVAGKGKSAAKAERGKRKASGTGRANSPLPAVPTAAKDAGGAQAAPAAGEGEGEATSDAIYANEETNVYEGVRHEGPIYENRNTGLYEALQTTPGK